jgi:hypothetical protein
MATGRFGAIDVDDPTVVHFRALVSTVIPAGAVSVPLKLGEPP